MIMRAEMGMNRRRVLASAPAGWLLAAASPVLAARPDLSATATRLSETVVRLTWRGGSGPASIYGSPNPDASPRQMRLFEEGVRRGTADALGGVLPRPYFLVATRDSEARVAERLLPLRGGRNFRDLGGYRAADGRQVRWGRIYRSGVMSGLTAQDMDYLDALGVRVVCDLRSTRERAAEPSPFLERRGVEVLALDYKLPSALVRLAAARTRDDAVAAFAGAYVELLEVLKPQLSEVLARLVREETPLAMNCTAGKDRTGIASALILSLLGVPRESVVADYALSEAYAPPAFYLRQASAAPASAGLAKVAAMPPQVSRVALGADPGVMRKLLAHVDAQYGGPIRLAKDALGLTEVSLARLRRSYLI